MSRTLQFINLLGVFALAVLCVMQWRADRNLNLELSAREKTRLDQAAKLEHQDKTIKGYVADLETFRKQLARANVSLKETEKSLAGAQREIRQLSNERNQLRISVTNWAGAVAARDEQLKQAAEQLQKLASDRNEAVKKFNELAENTILSLII